MNTNIIGRISNLHQCAFKHCSWNYNLLIKYYFKLTNLYKVEENCLFSLVTVILRKTCENIGYCWPAFSRIKRNRRFRPYTGKSGQPKPIFSHIICSDIVYIISKPETSLEKSLHEHNQSSSTKAKTYTETKILTYSFKLL